MKILDVELGTNSYPIYIETGAISKADSLIKEHLDCKKLFIITDTNVARLYLGELKSSLEYAGYQVYYTIVEAGEHSKDIQTLPKIYKELVAATISRTDAVIALGGGVVGDLAGFVASTYLRGVKFVQIPTSLLAQVDSSVGGKVAVDLAQGKNLVGSFYHPKLVIIDPQVIQTLEDKFINDGMGEVIKYACIRDYELYSQLLNFQDKHVLKSNLEEIIYTCCNIKRMVVESDEKDMGERMILNFGHTLGHAIETVGGYKQLTHGEAVSIGMYQVTRISEKLGLTKEGTSALILDLLQKYELPYKMPEVDYDEVLKVMGIDKKNLDSNLNVILLHEIGKCFIYKTDISFFESPPVHC
ncbi:MAG: 3-dehydroquinate synthase [Epulopiscium sp. Nuni2H_MBin001]|nr:MAG: 3-dehydroquinate synthase [Epulopiscium sp. Nuni2H_MBin001]